MCAYIRNNYQRPCCQFSHSNIYLFICDSCRPCAHTHKDTRKMIIYYSVQTVWDSLQIGEEHQMHQIEYRWWWEENEYRSHGNKRADTPIVFETSILRVNTNESIQSPANFTSLCLPCITIMLGTHTRIYYLLFVRSFGMVVLYLFAPICAVCVRVVFFFQKSFCMSIGLISICITHKFRFFVETFFYSGWIERTRNRTSDSLYWFRSILCFRGLVMP